MFPLILLFEKKSSAFALGRACCDINSFVMRTMFALKASQLVGTSLQIYRRSVGKGEQVGSLDNIRRRLGGLICSAHQTFIKLDFADVLLRAISGSMISPVSKVISPSLPVSLNGFTTFPLLAKVTHSFGVFEKLILFSI